MRYYLMHNGGHCKKKKEQTTNKTNQEITSISKDSEKLELLCILEKNVILCSHYGINSMAVLQKLKIII
jgi:hypothetical protein